MTTPRLAFAVVAFIVTAPAYSQSCDDSIVPQALELVRQQPKTGQEFSERLSQMDSYYQTCPEHPWVNALAAVTDTQAYELITRSNNGQPNQQAISFLSRALLRSNVYFDTPTVERKERFNLQLSNGMGNLRHEDIAKNRNTIFDHLMTLGRTNRIHPYLSGTEALQCTSGREGDTQRIGFAIKSKNDLVFLPFIDQFAEACRATGDPKRTLAIAVQARVYRDVVKNQLVTDEVLIRDYLQKAQQAESNYLASHNYDIHWSEQDSKSLRILLRDYQMTNTIPKARWFTPDAIESAEVTESIALEMNNRWLEITKSIEDDNPATSAVAGRQFSQYVFSLMNAGKEANMNEPAKAAIHKALTAFVAGDIRTSATQYLPMPSQMFLNVLFNSLKPQ
ncbi:hypothetical protein [Pseudidiomarina aestuarii]|uniref:hypothetical protein n=1 Tax=Pseudidiomarina aestuarii TaxID=624146 RepID=UPI003A980839